MVCSIFNTMSRHTEIIIATEFCNQLEARLVLCRVIVRNVMTFFLMFMRTYVTIIKKFVTIETFLPIFESKVDYVVTQRKYVATKNFFNSSKPMLRHTKILSRQCFSLSET